MKQTFLVVGVFCSLVLLLGANIVVSGEITNDRILLGSSAALGGPNAFLGTEFHKGAKLYFDEVNIAGGVHGRKIDIIVLDDGYEPERTIANTRKLIEEEKVDYLFGFIGTPTTVSILDMIEKEKIPLFAAFTGAEQLRKPVKRYMINVRASYYQETAGLVNYLLNDCGVERIACFYQDDAYGITGYTGVKLALEKYGLTLCGEGTYERNTVAITQGLEEIKKSSPDAVIMIGQYTACAAFIKAAKMTELKNIYFCNISFVGSDELNVLLGEDAEGAICSQVVPDLKNEENPLTKEFTTKYQKTYQKDTPNHVAYEGYISAIIFVEGLKRAGENLTRESFIDALEKIRDLDIGISDTIRYGKFDHQGLDKVYYSIVKNGREIALTNWLKQAGNNRILLGSSAALGGPNAFLGTEFHKGAKLYFDEVNIAGGVYGRKIDIIVLDDGYEPERTIANTRKLIEEEKVDYLFGFIGTPTTVSILDMIEKEKIPLFAAFTGAEQLRKPVKRYMINVRASYYQETAGLVNYLLNDCGVERIACFYQDDAYGGRPIYIGLKHALEKYGLALCGEGTYERNTVAITQGLEEIKKSSPDAVIMVGEYAACAAFIKAAKMTELKNIYFCSISFVASDKLAALLGEDAEGAICSQVVPDLKNEENPLTKEFTTKYQKTYQKDTPNHVAYEGYISAIIFVEGLKRAGENLTRESFIDALEKIRDLDIGISDTIRYGKFDHQGLDKVYYSIVKNGREIALTNWLKQAVK